MTVSIDAREKYRRTLIEDHGSVKSSDPKRVEINIGYPSILQDLYPNEKTTGSKKAPSGDKKTAPGDKRAASGGKRVHFAKQKPSGGKKPTKTGRKSGQGASAGLPTGLSTGVPTSGLGSGGGSAF